MRGDERHLHNDDESNEMNNMDSARQSLLEVLEHAQQGADFYGRRVHALTLVLEALDRADGVDTGAAPAAKSRIKTKADSSPRAVKTTVATAKLPATGTAFWMSLLSTQEQTAAQLLERAITTLHQQGTQLTDEQRIKIRGRLSVALFAMNKSGQVSSNGTGRKRTYFVNN